MKTLGYYNGKIDELDKITIPMLDRACYFGDGVYDVTFSRNYKVYKLREHVERIFASAALLKIYPQITPDELCLLVEELVKKLMALPDITVCPHGRPVAMVLTHAQIDRQFKR